MVPDPLPPDFDVDKARGTVESCTLEGYEACAWATCHFDYTDQANTISDEENVMILPDEIDGKIRPRSALENVSRRTKGSRYALMEKTEYVPPMHWPQRFEKIMFDFLRQSSGDD